MVQQQQVRLGGAGGAVGLACVQLAKLRGAKIVAATSSTEKAHLARESGADFIVSSQSNTLVSDIKQIITQGVDVVLDPIGGSFFEETLKEFIHNYVKTLKKVLKIDVKPDSESLWRCVQPSKIINI